MSEPLMVIIDLKTIVSTQIRLLEIVWNGIAQHCVWPTFMFGCPTTRSSQHRSRRTQTRRAGVRCRCTNSCSLFVHYPPPITVHTLLIKQSPGRNAPSAQAAPLLLGILELALAGVRLPACLRLPSCAWVRGRAFGKRLRRGRGEAKAKVGSQESLSGSMGDGECRPIQLSPIEIDSFQFVSFQGWTCA